MNYKRLLESIWCGEIGAATAAVTSPTARLLGAMLPVTTVSLISSAPLARPMLLLDETELVPGVTMGDVLAEEIDLDIPFGCAILVEAAEAETTPREASGNVGHMIGEMLQRLVGAGDLPVEQETEALIRLARAAEAMAAQPLLRLQGLDFAAFRQGLLTAMGLYWLGERPANAAAAAVRGFDCPDLLSYLQRLDGGFLPPADDVTPALLRPASGIGGFADWARSVCDRLQHETVTRTARA